MTKIICDTCAKEIDEDNTWSEKRAWRANIGNYAFEIKIDTTRISLSATEVDVHICRDCMAEMLNKISWSHCDS